MIFIDRRFKRELMRGYICYIDGFIVDWCQSINKKEEVVGIGGFNQRKSFYKYKKKGYGAGMYKRIVNLSGNKKRK